MSRVWQQQWFGTVVVATEGMQLRQAGMNEVNQTADKLLVSFVNSALGTL